MSQQPRVTIDLGAAIKLWPEFWTCYLCDFMGLPGRGKSEDPDVNTRATAYAAGLKHVIEQHGGVVAPVGTDSDQS